MSANRYVVIANPAGGVRRGAGVTSQVEHSLRTAGHTVVTHQTMHHGHARQIAAEIDLTDCVALCAVGGDGTLHQIVNGLLRRTDGVRPPVGIIPAGTGNSVLHHVGLCDPQQAVRRILAGKTAPLDVLEVATPEAAPYYCVNLVGWGILADINRVAERWRLLGRSRYAVAALSHLFAARSRPATLTIDGQRIRDEFLFVVACNTRTIGSGMQMAPRAQIDDGRMDVVFVRQTTRLRMLTILRRVFSGTHVDLPEVEYAQASILHLESDGREPLNLDGEHCSTAPFTVKVLPGALEVFVR